MTLPAVTHPSLPITVSPLPALGAGVLSTQLGHIAGTLVAIESQGATGALYTVPAGKVFSGMVRLVAIGAGTATMSAATGGTLASITDPVNLANTVDEVVPVTVAGGGGGNAISVSASGGASIVSAALVGHVK